MTPTPKTIQIFLPGGDPRGIRIAEITTRIVQVIEVPRSLLSDFLKMPESDQVALYFLFGADEEGVEEQVYIGQSGDLRARLTMHNKEKAFWQRTLVLISRTNNLTQTHALFLEWHSLQIASKTDRYASTNGNTGSKPHTPAPMEADCFEIFDTGRILLATLGYPIFEPVVRSAEQSTDEKDEIFYCRGSDADGRGIYTPEGFVVLKGSSGRVKIVQSISETSLEQQRSKLLQTGILQKENNRIIFQKDHLFSSPSAAATALQGRSSNGWLEWKNADNRTLDEEKRQIES